MPLKIKKLFTNDPMGNCNSDGNLKISWEKYFFRWALKHFSDGNIQQCFNIPCEMFFNDEVTTVTCWFIWGNYILLMIYQLTKRYLCYLVKRQSQIRKFWNGTFVPHTFLMSIYFRLLIEA